MVWRVGTTASSEVTLVECPKCGFKQPVSDECLACGIIFSKYRGPSGETGLEPVPVLSEAALVEQATGIPVDVYESIVGLPPEAPEYGSQSEPLFEVDNTLPSAAVAQDGLLNFEVDQGVDTPQVMPPESIPVPLAEPPQSSIPSPAASAMGAAAQSPAPGARVSRHAGVFRRDARASDTIGAFTMFVRSLAALACLGIAVLMFLNGKGLISAWPYIIMVFYAGTALWGLSSFQQDITLQQFATEMIILVIVTLGLRVATPEMFAVEQPEVGVAATVEPYLPATPIGRFTKQALAYSQSAQTIIGLREGLSPGKWDSLKADVDFNRLKQVYGMLGMDDQARVLSIWQKIDEVGAALDGSLERHTQRSSREVNFLAPEAERQAVARELADASRKLNTLREMLLVYPEED